MIWFMASPSLWSQSVVARLPRSLPEFNCGGYFQSLTIAMPDSVRALVALISLAFTSRLLASCRFAVFAFAICHESVAQTFR
jgi:hypothetical protein